MAVLEVGILLDLVQDEVSCPPYTQPCQTSTWFEKSTSPDQEAEIGWSREFCVDPRMQETEEPEQGSAAYSVPPLYPGPFKGTQLLVLQRLWWSLPCMMYSTSTGPAAAPAGYMIMSAVCSLDCSYFM